MPFKRILGVKLNIFLNASTRIVTVLSAFRAGDLQGQKPGFHGPPLSELALKLVGKRCTGLALGESVQDQAKLEAQLGTRQRLSRMYFSPSQSGATCSLVIQGLLLSLRFCFGPCTCPFLAIKSPFPLDARIATNSYMT